MTSHRQDRQFAAHIRGRNALGDVMARLVPPGSPIGCARPRAESHRSARWRIPARDGQPAGPWVCGLCHPPPFSASDLEAA